MSKIVVLDDERNISLVLKIALTGDGHEVETFTNGREGLERLCRGPVPDLVIADLKMPGASGQTVVTTVRRDSRLCSVPIVILSGCVPSEGVFPAAGSYDAFIGKPFDLDILLSTVNRLTRQRDIA